MKDEGQSSSKEESGSQKASQQPSSKGSDKQKSKDAAEQEKAKLKGKGGFDVYGWTRRKGKPDRAMAAGQLCQQHRPCWE